MMTYQRLDTVLHTGLQTLAVLGVGWATARWQLLKQAATNSQVVSLLNTLIMRVCLPALQLLLLGVHTDMRHMHNWKMVAAFMLWTAVIQVATGVYVLLCEGGRLDRWGAHALVLSANNTGVLAPVVLEAALGEGVGYIGMLATVCLYFQQLPVSEALMAAGQAQRPQLLGSGKGSTGGSAVLEEGGSEVAVGGAEGQQAGVSAPGPRMVGQSGAAGLPGVSWSSLLLKNPLVWTTGLAALLSTAGSSELLTPGGSHSIQQLAFVSGSLEWLARCSVPLTLLSTGVWLHGRTHLVFGGKEATTVLVYLALKLFALPWVMVGITNVMGIGGKHGMALLLLTAVPVAQTAFVLSERYQCCTEAVTATLIAGLLLLLPHLLLVMWAVEALGLYQTTN